SPSRSTLFPYTTLFRSEMTSQTHAEVGIFVFRPDVAREFAVGQTLIQLSDSIFGVRIIGVHQELPGAQVVRQPGQAGAVRGKIRSEEHTSELQSRSDLV